MIGPICAFLSAVTWAIGSTVYAKLSKTYSSFAVNMVRAGIALPLFILAIFVSEGWTGGWESIAAVRGFHLFWFGISMVASFGFGDVVFFKASRQVGVPVALAIASSFPIWTTVLGVVIGHDSFQWTHVLGATIAVSGVITVILAGARSPAKGRASGLALAFLTSLFWAVNTFAVSYAGKSLPAPVGSAIRMTLAMGLIVAFARVIAPKQGLLLPWGVVRKYFWIIALEAFAGTYFFMVGLSQSPLAVGAVLSSLAPVLSVPIALILRTERFSPLKFIGTILVVLGVAVLLVGDSHG